MPLERGKLVLSKKGKPQIEIEGKRFNPAQTELSPSILSRLKELNGAEVEFEWEGGQPKRIREVRSQFTPGYSAVASRAGHTKTFDQRKAPPGRTARRGEFHNPYNFIPALPRKREDPDLGDHEPVAQDRFDPDRITGRIRVEMEAATPLLVPDPNTCREDERGHKTFALLLDRNNKPLLPSSSVRGMLRSAYEAVTNSRLGRFPEKEHDKPLAYRMVATEGLRLIPARIQDGKIHLMCGTSKVSNDGFPEGPQYAAWLPRYSGSDKNTSRALTYPDGGLPQHGDEVECQVELIQHCRWDQQKETHVADFQYWRVQAIARAGNVLPSVSPAEAGSRRPGRSWHQPTGETRNIHGWVCITNANINRKYHERVFFREGTPPGPFPLTDTIRKQWVHLIENYQRIHEEDLNKRQKRSQEPDQYLGPEPGQTAWSRHVYRKEDRELEDGTLCYALLRNDNSAVEALFPVMIARRLYPATPWDLLHESLRPASTILDLSPADRVFGWVKGDSDSQGEERRTPTAARGLLRIGPVTCDSSPEEAVETFLGAGLPLAILAAPKLQQGRFYVAAYCQGEAQPDGLSKVDAGYSSGKGLRGRKVYPHHRSLPEDHWVNPLEDRTQNEQGPWQEYRRPRKDEREQRDDQNRSFLGWIKPGARFRFDIHVTNLSEVELGALLYLLKLPEGHYHRFGGGKPLGFGSVRLSVAESELRTGEVLRERYRAWSIRQSAEDICENALAAFKQAVFRAYGPATGAKSFEQVPFIRAFLKTCTGFEDGLLVHYPRVTRKPSPDGESFKWFVANEKKGSNTRRALPNLVNDAGLPIFPDPTRRGERRR